MPFSSRLKLSTALETDSRGQGNTVCLCTKSFTGGGAGLLTRLLRVRSFQHLLKAF